MGRGAPARRTSAAGLTAWIAVCSYTYGTNIYIRSTDAEAVRAAAEDILESCSARAGEEDYDELFALIRAGRFDEAMDRFDGLQGHTFGSHARIGIYEIVLGGDPIDHQVRLRS